MAEFAHYFEADKAGAKASHLKVLFDEIRSLFPEVDEAGSKEARAAALQSFEAERPELCALLPSEDQFYGVGQVGKLRTFVQWIYVPAVKDAAGEQAEARNTALGRLVARTVRAKVDFADQLQSIRTEAELQYKQLIDTQQGALDEVSNALQARLADWSIPGATARLNWHQDPKTAVRVEEPLAKLIAGDGHFEGSISRFGHGLQRSYLIALLQGLASLDDSGEPRLILGCEEPELYQHPPQARHLASVLERLGSANSQVVITTHSPLFVEGRGFEAVRLVQKDAALKCTHVRQMTFVELGEALSNASGEPAAPANAVLAKLHQALQPAMSEMFFTNKLVLVEGLEDQAYITAWLRLTDRWDKFRRGGCQIIPANGKSEIARPLAIAFGMQIPVFTIFDADGDKLEHTDENTAKSRRALHEKDNRTILSLVGSGSDAFPNEVVWGDNYVVWPSDLADTLKSEAGNEAWGRYNGAASVAYANAGGLQKNSLHIAERLLNAHADGCLFPTMERLCDALLAFSGQPDLEGQAAE